MFRSIRWRIAVPFVLLILLAMTGLGLYLWNFVRSTYLTNLESQLTNEARLAADSLAAQMAANGDPAALDGVAKRWAGLLDARVTIIRADGLVIGESHEDRTQMENHLSRPEVLQALSGGVGVSTRYSQTVGYQMMYVAVPIVPEAQTPGFVRLALPLVEIQENLNHLGRVLVSAAALTAALAVLLALWIAGRTTYPLRELTYAAAQISEGDWQGHIIPTTQDEVGQLTRAFNTMAVQLRSQIDALESERSKMAAVLNEMTDGVLIVNAEGEIQLLNPAAESMFEISAQKVMGRGLIEVLRHHQLVDLWRQCQKTGELQVATLEISSRRLYLQGVATPLGQALPGSTLLLFQNLTRLRQLETVRRDFISNISHELRTPLASLKALTETLQAGALDDPPAARRFLQHMEMEVDALSLMVSELLELARIESGRVPLRSEACRPVDLLQRSVERLRLQAERAGLQVEIDCREDLPPVLADPGRMEQVLVNLLHNAIKFTPTGGRITLHARAMDDKILFSVQDTGVGIPAADLSRIFERFYKTDRARASGGTGLGLAISRHIVEAHGGQIWAESGEGQGSTFFFTVPLAP